MIEPAFLIDSNIAIYILEGRPESMREVLESRRPGEVALSVISYAEVMRGIPPEEEERERRARQLFQRLPVLPFDRAAAEAYRRLPFKRGRFDSLIAAHALALGVVLVTNNEKDFAGIDGLTVENWAKS